MIVHPIGGGGGLTPQIVVTAPTGSTVSCDGVQGTESSGKWTFNVSVKKDRILPEGYTKLEYIESSGTQYIDTGIKPISTTVIDCCVSGFNSSSTVAAFGAENDGSVRCSLLRVSSKYRTDIGSGDVYSTLATTNAEITVKYQSGSATLNGVSNSTGTMGGVNYSIYLFARNSAGTKDLPSSCKIHYFKIYEGTTIVRNFIPCLNSDGTVGMYDLVSRTFFGNSGTGTFTGGAEADQYEYHSYVITATLGTKSQSKSVTVDRVALYEVEIDYKLWLYKYGDECEDVTGGWDISGKTWSGQSVQSHTKNSSDIAISKSSSTSYVRCITTNNKINLANLSRLVINANISATYGSGALVTSASSTNLKYDASGNSLIGAITTTGSQDYTFDISSLSDSRYLDIACYTSYYATGNIYKIWLE